LCDNEITKGKKNDIVRKEYRKDSIAMLCDGGSVAAEELGVDSQCGAAG
jgi:hypothetical protein